MEEMDTDPNAVRHSAKELSSNTINVEVPPAYPIPKDLST